MSVKCVYNQECRLTDFTAWAQDYIAFPLFEFCWSKNEIELLSCEFVNSKKTSLKRRFIFSL